MKITRSQLRRIIKEEKTKLLNENRQEAYAILEELEMMGVSADRLVDYLIGNWMSGADALEALQNYKQVEM